MKVCKTCLSFLLVTSSLSNTVAQDSASASGENVVTSPLSGLYGKGLVISDNDRGLFWQNSETNFNFFASEEPVEYHSRFFAVQGPTDGTVFLRQSDFQYVCVNPVTNQVEMRFEDQVGNAIEEEMCQFIVTAKQNRTTTRTAAIAAENFELQCKGTGLFLRIHDDNNSIVADQASNDGLPPFTIRDEQNVIVDLGFLEQFLSNDKAKEDFPVLNIFASNERTVNHDFSDLIKADGTDVFSDRQRWTMRRVSRLSNGVTIQIQNTEHMCTNNNNILQGIQKFNAVRCTFIPILASDGTFRLFQPSTQRFIKRTSTNNLEASARFAQQGEVFLIKPAEPRLAAMEIIDVEFDSLVTQSLPFTPDEIKTVTFKNDSPVDQVEKVSLNESTSITTETSWSSSFFTESEVKVESKFDTFLGKGSFSARLKVGFSTDQGRKHKETQDVKVNYSKTFTVPACTDMSISIASAASQKTSVPFVATIRQTNVDGTIRLFRTTGSHTGVVLDQIQVDVNSKPIPGCVVNSQRRGLRGDSNI